WFFETFVLKGRPGHRPHHPAYEVLFNSYYNAVGEQFPRPRRGLLTRPTVAEIWRYREVVDAQIGELLAGTVDTRTLAVVELGLHHEQQHQELMLTDLKHAFAQNPLAPAYRDDRPQTSQASPPLAFVPHAGGVVEVGHAGRGFAFDNEGPRHETLLAPFALGSRLTTAGDYLAFIEDDGYRRPELWLSEGWAFLEREAVRAPLYWSKAGDGWELFTLRGQRPLDPHEPVTHVSYYEADAFARWAGARLPREHELEVMTRPLPVAGNFLDSDALHPRPAGHSDGAIQQAFGDCWTWTMSPYTPYPGFRAPEGALGEYNGKFMCNQHVLRGGSCVSPASHLRATYRNFFPASARWQFSGIRLAKDA
ncbi:MAG: ergothioneine biosynthesis protein EgtB, partial [Myxococcales bacterium]|nr:ergothioneine biosynthesis protein EgtB [Myxococcales bacterium]